MFPRTAWMFLGVLAALAAEAAAQMNTTVQLPTFSFTSVATTVSVPDGGSALLGGINRAATGRNEFGVPGLGKLPFVGRPFTNNSIGSQYGAQNMRVSVTIHDFEAMDQYLRGVGGAGPLVNAGAPAAALASVAPRPAGPSPIWQAASRPDQPTMSLAEAQAKRVLQESARRDEARDFFERGQKAEAEGKTGAAKIFYQMAARRAAGPLKEQVAARLQAIGAASSGSQVVQSGR